MTAWRILAAALVATVATAHGYDSKWGDLGPVATGRKTSVSLRDGSRVRGKVVEVAPEGLRMATSKQEIFVPRREVRALRVSRTTKHWRAIGTVIGLGAGLPGAVVLDARLSNEGAGSPAVALVAIVPAALGYLAGWSADRKTLEIRVIPEP
ncbi:MAG TPA: hypothetical protein VN442_16520 [Bryobacteraceae bacterium]|nr:hypothetical protein [Bryobacteraceae bacterium]